MKKFVVIILLILPVFLVVTISLIGRILAPFVYIPVESVHFVDESNEIIEDSITMGLKEELQLKVLILPIKANNQRVTYDCITDDMNPVISVTKSEGRITAHRYETATVIVTTDDGKHTASINIIVADYDVEDVIISQNSLSLKRGQTSELYVTITPQTALNKSLEWEVSDSSKVGIQPAPSIPGCFVVSALEESSVPVIITFYADDRMKSATCAVTVSGIAPLIIRSPLEPVVTSVPELNLLAYVEFDPSVFRSSDIMFEIVTGFGATILGSTLQFSEKHIITVRAYAVDAEGVTHYTAAKTFIYN